MAITLADFNKIWASTSPLTPYSFSESNYKQGWNFIGSTPPARQMWDYLQKNNDEKMQYIANNYLPLSGGTLTGQLTFNDQSTMFTSKYATLTNTYSNNGGYIAINGGNSDDGGARFVLYGQNYSGSPADGGFYIRAKKENTSKVFEGKVDGTLSWDGKDIERVNSQGGSTSVGGIYIRYESGLQICYGGGNATTSGTQITFSAAFIATPRIIAGSANADGYGSASSDTATGFKLHNSLNTAYTNWIAIGVWK